MCHVLIAISPICTVMCRKLRGSSESGGFSPRMIFGCPRDPGVWDPHPEPQWPPWPGGAGCWALIWVLDRPAVELAPPPSPPRLWEAGLREPLALAGPQVPPPSPSAGGTAPALPGRLPCLDLSPKSLAVTDAEGVNVNDGGQGRGRGSTQFRTF